MRRFLSASFAVGALALAVSAVSLVTPVLAADAAADPTVDQIYEAAKTGHFDQAQTMMDQVLRDHPKSGKAHYIQAELYAKQGKTALARSELAQAEEFDPGLTHESPRSVQELKSELGMGPRSTQAPRIIGMTSAPAAPRFPWGTVLILVAVVGVLWMLFRRRSPATYAVGGPVVSGGPGYGGGAGYGGPGYGGPAGYGGGGGIGSGIAGGLASGLAVGAGVVAGEELAHHFLDGGNRETSSLTPVDNGEWQEPSSNSDMGGSDFGVNDPGSWDDSGGGGGGGGDDWT